MSTISPLIHNARVQMQSVIQHRAPIRSRHVWCGLADRGAAARRLCAQCSMPIPRSTADPRPSLCLNSSADTRFFWTSSKGYTIGKTRTVQYRSLFMMFPNSKFVFVIRDGRAVCRNPFARFVFLMLYGNGN